MGPGEKQPVGYSQFACIGSGFSAIGLGATLKRWYGITDVRFFERHEDLGGTWFVNTYPGAACDIPSILYSFSFAPNPKWTRVLPSSGELWDYLKTVAAEYDLPSKMSFGVVVERCEWIEATHRWRLHLRKASDGSTYAHECQFLFSGTGILVQPREPDMPGIESFQGPVFHAARWRSDVALEGKNVAVIGNGCTATQIVPNIIEGAEHVTQFARSKHWMIPPIDVPQTQTIQWLFGHVPGLMALVRAAVFVYAENDMRGFYMTKAAARFRAGREAEATRYIKKHAPAKYHDMLIPDFEIGCKRRIFDCGYLKALHAPNLDVVDDPIVEILPQGIRTKNGSVTKTDVIVLANGYSTNQFMAGIEVAGRNGVTLGEHWSKFDGPEAYNCVAMNEFPNFFMILGPNSTTGHTSTIMAVENGINYALRVLKPVLDGDATTVEVKHEAEARYSRQMQEDLHKSVWWGGCQSWYNTAGKRSGKTWNSMTYPHSQAHYWYKCLFPNYQDWTYTLTPGAPRRLFLRRVLKLVLWTGAFISAIQMSLLVRKNGLKLNNYLVYLLQGYQKVRGFLPF
ncbi:hypothetical protein DCS_00993 [Drechmeria coniospora]|uniref:Monooxygenase n=1 Tax=Drechmeria coniospora TaxID=98403 RepID=A0A151GRX5_DRECN|nr:hypothetical protein DCS_00993 [Drechmeria coniospora]KYK59859.1 hypothetical protein DCS_00993 [Drechmeria coniospora]ODA78656.1 hypothetical protein RJ55_06038 [Drechmeria coniospora]